MLPAGPAPMTQTLAMGRSSQADSCGLRLGRQPEIGLEAVMQPAADVVASRPAAPDDFVMAAAAAEIARPAGPAGLLPVNMPRGQPIGLAGKIDAIVKRAHCAQFVADKTVAGREGALGGG